MRPFDAHSHSRTWEFFFCCQFQYKLSYLHAIRLRRCQCLTGRFNLEQTLTSIHANWPSCLRFMQIGGRYRIKCISPIFETNLLRCVVNLNLNHKNHYYFTIKTIKNQVFFRRINRIISNKDYYNNLCI